MPSTKVVTGHSLRAYARHRGCTLRAVQKARDSGRLTVVDGKIPDLETADQEWEARTDPDQKLRRDAATATRAGRAKPNGKANGKANGAAVPQPRMPSDLEVAKTRREVVRATREELELGRLQGQLIPAEEAAAATEKIAAQEREALLNWPPRVAADLAAKLGLTEPVVFAALDREIRAFLEERSQKLLNASP